MTANFTNDEFENLATNIANGLDDDRAAILRLTAFLTIEIAAIEGDSCYQVLTKVETECNAFFARDLPEL
jgi:hypothetical protein